MAATDRKVIHMLCDELRIQHESRGEGARRHVRVIFDDVSEGSHAHSDVDDFFEHFDLDSHLPSDEDY